MMTTCKPGLFDPPPPPPPRGVPDALVAELAGLLALARRLRDQGRPRAEVIARVLAASRQLPVRQPAFSAGGLADCIRAVIGEPRPPLPTLGIFCRCHLQDGQVAHG